MLAYNFCLSALTRWPSSLCCLVGMLLLALLLALFLACCNCWLSISCCCSRCSSANRAGSFEEISVQMLTPLPFSLRRWCFCLVVPPLNTKPLVAFNASPEVTNNQVRTSLSG